MLIKMFNFSDNFFSERFTLIELLVVVAIIAILAGLLMPALVTSRNKALNIQCTNNLRQIQLKLESYQTDSGGVYPPAEVTCEWGDGTGWMNLISENNSDRNLMLCPLEQRRDFSYSLNCREVYIKNGGTFGSWDSGTIDKMSVSPSNFIFIEESDSNMFTVEDCDQDNYTQGVNSFMESNPKHPSAGVPFLYADGHVTFERKFHVSTMTYFTDEMASWY